MIAGFLAQIGSAVANITAPIHDALDKDATQGTKDDLSATAHYYIGGSVVVLGAVLFFILKKSMKAKVIVRRVKAGARRVYRRRK